jgi:hypothetical protein
MFETRYELKRGRNEDEDEDEFKRTMSRTCRIRAYPRLVNS